MNSLPPMPQTAAFFLKSGTQFKQEGKLDDAIAAYKQALEINPNYSWAYHSLGEAYAQLGCLDEAVSAYSNALNINPVLILSYQSLGEVLGKLGRIDEAIALYSKALELNPNLLEGHQELGDKLQSQGKLIEAVACYCQAIEINPDSALVHDRLWKALCQSQQWEQAITTYHRALEVNPNSSLVYHHLGASLSRLQRWDEAVVYFHRCLELAPESLGTLRLLGDVLMIQADIEYAINIYQQILNLQPGDMAAYGCIANCLIGQGKINEAIGVYQQAVQLDPEYVNYYYNLAWLLSQQSQWEEAILYYQKACQIKPEYLNKLESVKDCFSNTSKYKFINLQSLAASEQNYLENMGFSLSKLKLMEQDNNEWRQVIKDTNKLIYPPLGILDFELRILETGYIDSYCPISGARLISNQSFYLGLGYNIIFYRFAGSELFYLIVGCSYSYKLGIYFPFRDLIISFSDPNYPVIGQKEFFEYYVNYCKSYVVNFLEAVRNYLLNLQPRKVTNVIGFLGNIGHFFWNELSALQELVEIKKLNRLNSFVVGNYNYYDIREIFPEIAAESPEITFLNIKDEPAQEIAFETCLITNSLVLTLTSWLITEKLANRIYHYSVKYCQPSFLQKVGESKKCFPIIWVTLRSHKRVWISQVEGIANIIKELYNNFPSLGIIFDGHPSEKGNLEDILALIPPSVKIYNALDCAVYETIVWVHAIDLFIAPWGAGTIFTSIANKPGVLHVNTQLCSLEPCCPSPRENFVFAVTVPRDAVIDSVDLGFNHPHTRNYDCDWKAIYNEAIKIVDTLQKRKNEID